MLDIKGEMIYNINMKEYICTKCKKVKQREFMYYVAKTRNTGLCKGCKSIGDKEYRHKNKEKLARYFKNLWESSEERRVLNKKYKETQRFGFDVTAFIIDKKCEICGMTNKEHKKRHNERLHIHHMNNNGAKNKRLGLEPINDINRLQVLCRPCHVREDNKNRDYTGRGYKIWETRRKNQKK